MTLKASQFKHCSILFAFLVLNLKGLLEVDPRSRTRFQILLKSIEIHGSQLIDIEPVVSRSWKAVETY